MARILVVGGSLGGLMVANMLLRDGHDVRVLEKAAGSLDGRGAGIVTHAKLVEGLSRAGLDASASLGVAVPGRVLLDARGAVELRLPMPQVLTSWSRLYALLHGIFPAERYLQPVSVSAVQLHDGGVSVQHGAQTWRADLLIASDGIRSAVRQQFAPEVQPQYAGYLAWRGVCDEAVLSRHTRETVFGQFGFGLPAGEQLIGYPVAGPGHALEPGRRSYNFVWYRPAPEGDVLRSFLTDDDGMHHPHGIAPARVSWRHIAAMRAAARELLAPQFAEMLEKTAQPFLQAIYDVSSTQVAFGRVALMGDAAFVARPHVGAGVTKAAEDAMALADSIRAFGATPTALLAYEQVRLPVNQAIVERARRMGAYLQACSAGQPVGGRDAQAVLHDTALELSSIALDEMIFPRSAAAVSH
jgi:2-polyprenyl-6-methoxyphenol hydroxylase-like FAD-dependent oxidoreductase